MMKLKEKWQGFSPVEKYLIIFLMVLIIAFAFRFTAIWEQSLAAFQRWNIFHWYSS
ncbi:MAG: hypothetical protein ACQESW_09755 [Bacteroidota bacterium]